VNSETAKKEERLRLPNKAYSLELPHEQVKCKSAAVSISLFVPVCPGLNRATTFERTTAGWRWHAAVTLTHFAQVFSAAPYLCAGFSDTAQRFLCSITWPGNWSAIFRDLKLQCDPFVLVGEKTAIEGSRLTELLAFSNRGKVMSPSKQWLAQGLNFLELHQKPCASQQRENRIRLLQARLDGAKM